jgi:hypothetical protein
MRRIVRWFRNLLPAWLRQRWWLCVALAGMAAALTIGLVLSLLLLKQTEELLVQVHAVTSDKDRADLTRSALQYQADNIAKIWTTAVQGVGAIVLALGAVATWRNLQVAQENARVSQDTLRVTQERLDIDRQAQITNRFTQAIGQLGAELKDGKPNLEVRLGGIYALERIARDFSDYRWTITEVLTAYVRQNAPRPSPPFPIDPDQPSRPELWNESANPPKPRVDIQTVLTVLGRRILAVDHPEPGRLDLRGTDLRGADLTGARLEGASLLKSNLGEVSLRHASLEGANLEGANLQQANLTGVHLEMARLARAHLEGATLTGAHLKGTDLTAAHVERVVFWRTHVGDAYLLDAYLEGTDLTSALGLTTDQVYRAWEHGKGALLPADWPADWLDQMRKRKPE